MRRLLLFVSPLLLSACVAGVVNSIQRERNPRCENVQEIEVFQVFGDGALAFTCKRTSYDDCAWGITVAVPKDLSDILYDKQRIIAPKDKCIVYTSTYQYKNKDGDTNTVPVVGFEYEYSPSNEIEAEERLKETKSEIYDACLEEMGKVSKKTSEKNKQKCSCVSDTIIEKLITIMIEDPEADIESVGPKIIQDIESKCGQLPKGMKI